MGAQTFFATASGKSAREAFNAARDDAAYECGHGGYTGTIAEKDRFVMITVPEGVKPMKHAEALMDAQDRRIDDKWGPAGCIALGGDRFLFFGWASS